GVCGVPLPPTGCSTSAALDAKAYPVTALYSGDPTYQPQSTTTAFTITPLTTSLVAQFAAPAVGYGVSDPLSASGLPAGASGTVRFSSGGQTLCTVTLPATT